MTGTSTRRAWALNGHKQPPCTGTRPYGHWQTRALGMHVTKIARAVDGDGNWEQRAKCPSRSLFAREKFCLSHLACGGRQPKVCDYGWRMALGPPHAEKIRPVTERCRVHCATHSPSAVTWPAYNGLRRRRRRRDHTRIIVVILVAAVNANATAGSCYTAIAKTEFALRFPLQPPPPRVPSEPAAPPPRRHSNKTPRRTGKYEDRTTIHPGLLPWPRYIA